MLFRIFPAFIAFLAAFPSPALLAQTRGKKEPPPSNGVELRVAKFPEFANCAFRLTMTAKLDLYELEHMSHQELVQEMQEYMKLGEEAGIASLRNGESKDLAKSLITLASGDTHVWEISFDPKGKPRIKGAKAAAKKTVEFTFPYPPINFIYDHMDPPYRPNTHKGIMTFEGSLAVLADGKQIIERPFRHLFRYREWYQKLRKQTPLEWILINNAYYTYALIDENVGGRHISVGIDFPNGRGAGRPYIHHGTRVVRDPNDAGKLTR